MAQKSLRSPWLVAVVTLSFLSFSCVTNPARRMPPNDEEVQVLDGTIELDIDGDGDIDRSTDFIRGKAGLDEQEFYEAIGDTASYDTVKGSRTTGTIFQGVGFGAMMLGILGALGGIGTYLFSEPIGEMPAPLLSIPEDTRPYVLYGVYGSAALAALGGLLFFAMQPKSRGDKNVFDLPHARRQLEVGLYGENGATPDDIKSLSFGKGQDGTGVCSGGTLALTPIIALDARGRHMKVTDRADWFTWLSTPAAGLVDQQPDAPLLHSSIGPNYKFIDSDINVKIAVAQTGVGHELTLTHSFACGGALGRSGTSGDQGKSGKEGKKGDSGLGGRVPGAGVNGTDGTDGVTGGAGPKVVAEVAWVSTPKRGRLALVIVDGNGALFDPSSTSFEVYAGGGTGGRGGTGGHGGRGGSASSGSCMPGGTGGTGGRGGRGGQGGPGGSVTVRASDEALLRAVRAIAPGGSGGAAGNGGSRGDAGSSGSCKKGFPSDGANGTHGTQGAPGQSGGDGTTTGDVVAVSQLTQITRFISENPELTLEGGSEVIPKKKRR